MTTKAKEYYINEDMIPKEKKAKSKKNSDFTYTGYIEQDLFDGYPQIQANNTVSRLQQWLTSTLTNEQKDLISKKLSIMIVDHYKADIGRFKKLKTAEKVRDFHLVFCPHWASAIVQEEFPQLFDELPIDFTIGKL